MVLSLRAPEAATSVPCRNVAPADLPALAELMAIAYKGTVHDLGHTPAEALAYIEQHTGGGLVGPMLWNCSFFALDAEAPVAAVFVSEESPGHPLIFDIYTHPGWRRRGLATALIHRSAAALRGRGFDHVWLKVAIENPVARHLYEQLGFVPE